VRKKGKAIEMYLPTLALVFVRKGRATEWCRAQVGASVHAGSETKNSCTMFRKRVEVFLPAPLKDYQSGSAFGLVFGSIRTQISLIIKKLTQGDLNIFRPIRLLNVGLERLKQYRLGVKEFVF
jgi:hypothetical protein